MAMVYDMYILKNSWAHTNKYMQHANRSRLIMLNYECFMLNDNDGKNKLKTQCLAKEKWIYYQIMSVAQPHIVFRSTKAWVRLLMPIGV